ncbi:hypothetical protein AMAG_16765 [Allomyces macrogynus ATCC 38327]|uniref:F-box domain-containing protein n=1 Tax=Allomyces macrogynus (strain ATCC 38327) TaxID=578462 RepID=A0A0L0TC33_ALLM3|nr:hypothetical protein AMAG_16765 [Allomyces macrogynus ATCC 38327]|eukprot:KNE72276.1 hypothetical protein AMAG_16765 [Allomyces macrogynus ATCC 38327]
MMALDNAKQNLPQLSQIEALPTVVQDVILGYLSTSDRSSIIQLARASPAFFANAIRAAIRTAPAKWTWLTVDPATQRPAVCRGESSLVGSLGACFKPGSSPLETAVYLVPAVCQYWTNTKSVCLNWTCADTRRDDRPIGPISSRDLRSLHIGQNIVSSFVLKTLPHVRRIAWCLQDMDAVKSHALVDEIERAGGIPAAVTDFDVHVLDAKSRTSSDERVDESTTVERLARLVAVSRVRHLTLTHDRTSQPTATVFEWSSFSSIRIPIAKPFLDIGLPQTTLTTLSIHLAEQWAHGLQDRVQWPSSLRCIDLDLQGIVRDTQMAQFFVSLARANLPHLDTLTLDCVLLSEAVTSAMVSVFRPSLVDLRFGAARGNDTDVSIVSNLALRLCTLIDGLAAKSPNLKRLHFFPVDRDVPAVDRRALAANVLPRLRNLPNLTDISLREWGAVATDKAVYSALMAVPNLQRLDLSKNRCITRRVVPILLRMIKRGNIVSIDLTETLIDRSGRAKVATAIKKARLVRLGAGVADA